MNHYISSEQMLDMGFASYGDNVYIHSTVIFINPDQLSLGSHVRIDAYSIITCGISECHIGDHVHISTHVFIAGKAGFELGDHTGLATGSKLLTTSDDFSGDYLTGPTHSAADTEVTMKAVSLGAYAVAGANSVIMPGANLGEGAILGSLSLAKSPLDSWSIYGGIPARRLKDRSRKLLDRLPKT